MKLTSKFSNFKLSNKSEQGSVTLFVLVAMLFFLVTGIMLFTNIMNTKASQKKDMELIGSEYKPSDSSVLEQKYDEAKQKKIGKFSIKVIDSFGAIYNSGEWINENWISENEFPLTISAVWPEGLASVDIVDYNSNGVRANSEQALDNVRFTQSDEGRYQVKGIIDGKVETTINVNIDVTKPVVANIDSGEISIIADGTDKVLNIPITATDPNGANGTTGSGMDGGRIEYIISTTPPGNNDTWTKYEGQIVLNGNLAEGDYYIYARAIDKARNISETKTSDKIRIAN